MSEEIIKTRTGTYGLVYVVVPMTVKESMLSWMRKSGLNKAELMLEVKKLV